MLKNYVGYNVMAVDVLLFIVHLMIHAFNVPSIS
jgi:hypothetical protein